jgi:D-lyxose ketol-isomerase
MPMLTIAEVKSARRRATGILLKAGVALRAEEIDQMEVADFGLSELELSGVQIVTLVDTEKTAAKLLVPLPLQTEPEHSHPSLGEYEGKEETVRCEWGLLYLYSPGEPAPNPKGHPP